MGVNAAERNQANQRAGWPAAVYRRYGSGSGVGSKRCNNSHAAGYRSVSGVCQAVVQNPNESAMLCRRGEAE